MSRKLFPKILLFLFAALSLTAAEEISYCQLLLSEAEQKIQGFDRQRKMYPPERAKRLSIMAVRNGSELLRKNKLSEAMAEFNRAWRFAPANPYSYWIAAIVRSMEAMQATRHEVKRQCFEDSLKLWEKCLPLLRESPKEVKVNFALDKAETLIRYAVFLSGTDPQKAGQLFRQADVLLKPFQPGNDPRNKMCYERARKMRSQIPEKEKTK